MRLYIVCLALTGVLMLSPTGWAKPQGDPHQRYDAGVTLYRQGDYQHAMAAFKDAVEAMPESQEAQYYYAMTLAQLGRFEEARKAYQAVITLAPNTPAAQMAQQGLQYLPDPSALDAPPKFQQTEKPAVSPAPQPTQAAAQNTSGMMDPKAMQMMMLMGSMSGGSGGFNPMMIPMMEQMTKGTDGKPDYNECKPELFMKIADLPNLFNGIIGNRTFKDSRFFKFRFNLPKQLLSLPIRQHRRKSRR